MPLKLDPTEADARVEDGEVGAASSLAFKISEDDDIGNDSNTITNSSFHLRNFNVNDNIVCEILSRLPVNSIMRFKCVSKHWCSMIRMDKSLVDLHFHQSKARPCLLITVPRRILGDDGLSSHEGYYWIIADLLFEGGAVSPVVRTIREMVGTPLSYNTVGPLNGLICLFDPQTNHSVQVCNLSTREVTPWIKSAFISSLNAEDKDKYHLHLARCDLGFDPATKEHKVICFWNIFPHQVCEIMTVGDGKWRMVDDLPAYNFGPSFGFGASMYVNGSIYYYCSEELPTFIKDDIPKFIMAFDVGEEKFRAIGIPDFIRDQIPHRYETFEAVQLLEIDGHPAILIRIRRDIAKMWLFDDDYNNGCRSNTWKEVTIQLVPFYWVDSYHRRNEYSVRFHSVIGTDFIILYLYRCTAIAGCYRFASVVSQYSYNWKSKIFAKIEINGLPSSIPYCSYVSGMSTFTESLLPVQ